MSAQLRIISDIHYGDRASSVHRLEQLAPLATDTTRLICNGDTTDTRPERDPDAVNQRRAELADFAQNCSSPVQFLTGNHDPDISDLHHLDLAAGDVLLTHGDILYHNIVPWGRDAALADKLVQHFQDELTSSTPNFTDLLIAHRRAARDIPQRHQAEKHGLKYIAGFVSDTLWPPSRLLRILKAWREFPHRGRKLLLTHRPEAQFLICGHTHRPGIWRSPHGQICINTGSFCPPSGQLMIDLEEDRLLVRKVRRQQRDYYPGKIIAQFPLTLREPCDTPS